MELKPYIFREYDIRGIVADDLSGRVPELIGRAYGSALRRRREGAGKTGAPTVVVGRDNRPSSPTLSADIIRGLQATGVNVIDIGTVPTPVLYYATVHYGTDGGLQITGSHNPPEYNGIKMMMEGLALYGESIQELYRLIEAESFESGNGTLEERDLLPDYIADVTNRFSIERPIKVVVDCGNGVGSLVAVQLLEGIGAEVVPLYCESDGTFPNHHPDPSVDENIQEMIERVRAEKADLGVAFDGDADRIGVVDENGEIIRGDLLLLIFGLDLLERRGPGQQMIFDVKCSEAVPEVFEAHGGKALMWKTGHSLIKKKMKETGAPIAGELSGHICFADESSGFDDAPYAACRLVDLRARSKEPLSAQVADFPAYLSTPEIRVEVAEEEKFGIVERATEEFSREYEVNAVDGARIQFPDGWGLLRASNTQPVLVLRYEAHSPEGLQKIREVMEGWLRGQGVHI
jgi:phosphomannomutase/phosphoglucomutase